MKQANYVATLGLFLTLACALPAVAAGNQQDKPVPDLTKDGDIDHRLNWTLGSTGARGWVFSHNNNTEKSRQIVITTAHPGSPADGVLQEGYVIVGIGEAMFDSEARKDFAAAVTQA